MPWVPGMPIADPGKYQAYLGAHNATAGQGGMPWAPNAPSGGGGGGSTHPHISAVASRTARTGNPAPSPEEQRYQTYLRSQYANVDPINTADPMYAYAQQFIDNYTTKTQRNQGAQNKKFVDALNQLGIDNPQTGPTIMQDVVRLLAPNYNPTGFMHGVPVMPSDMQKNNMSMNSLAQQFLNTPAGQQYTGDPGQQGHSILDKAPGIKGAPNPITGGRTPGMNPIRWAGHAIDAVANFLGGGSSGETQDQRMSSAKSALGDAMRKIMKDTPGIDANAAYHLLEADILKDNKGDIKPKDAQALWAKWQQQPYESPQAAAQQVQPYLMQLEYQKMQNAADYINMSSKQRTAAGLTSSVLSAIGMPAWERKTPDMVKKYIALYSQYAQQNAQSDLTKLLTNMQSRNRQATKAAQAGGQQGPYSSDPNMALKQWITNYIGGTNMGINPTTDTPYSSSSTGVDSGIASVP